MVQNFNDCRVYVAQKVLTEKHIKEIKKKKGKVLEFTWYMYIPTEL